MKKTNNIRIKKLQHSSKFLDNNVSDKWSFLKNIHVNINAIISSIFHIFLYSCGITLLVFFFGYDKLEATRRNVKDCIFAIFISFIALKLVYELLLNSGCVNTPFAWFPAKSNSLTTISKKTKLDKGGMGIAVKVEPKCQEENMQIIRVHEAGHAVMCYLMDVQNYTLFLTNTPRVSYEFIGLMDAEIIKKQIFIDYAGAAAEELILGKLSSGSMGDSIGDFDKAVKHIREYLMMTDPKYDKTGLDNSMNQKIVLLSNVFYNDVKELLSNHKCTLSLLIDELAKGSREVYSAEILTNIFEKLYNYPNTIKEYIERYLK